MSWTSNEFAGDGNYNTFYGPPAPYPDTGLFATKGYNVETYVAPYAGNTNVWSQQRTTNTGVNGRPLTGNYPDPVLQLRQKGASEQLRGMVEEWKRREDQTHRQMRFNYLESATDTSFVTTREDVQENYARLMQKIPFEDVRANANLLILLAAVWFLF